MFVVRRPFRNYGDVILPGSVVEPGNIKRFKTRLKDRVIIEVNAHNFSEWQEYFRGRHGIELQPLDAPNAAGAIPKFDEASDGTPEQPAEKKKVIAVAVPK